MPIRAHGSAMWEDGADGSKELGRNQRSEGIGDNRLGMQKRIKSKNQRAGVRLTQSGRGKKNKETTNPTRAQAIGIVDAHMRRSEGREKFWKKKEGQDYWQAPPTQQGLKRAYVGRKIGKRKGA